MDSTRQISRTVWILQALCLASALLFLVLGVLYWSAFHTGRVVTILDPLKLPEGEWQGEAPLFLYYDYGGVLSVDKEDGVAYVNFQATRRGTEDYNGLGVLGSFSAPLDADLELKWRRWGSSGGIDLHLFDSPPVGAQQTRGEDFQTTVAPPDRRWETTRVPLRSFRPNTYQEENVYVDGILNSRALQSVEIGLHEGALVRLDIASIRLVWKANLVPSLVFFALLGLFALLLLFRTPGRILPKGGSVTDLLSVVQSRIGFLFATAGFAAACIAEQEFGTSALAPTAFGILYTVLLVEEYQPRQILRRRWMLFRYVVPGILVLALLPANTYLAFALVFLQMIVPSLVARDRQVLLLLVLGSAALLALHPYRSVPDFLIFHLLTLAATALLAYGLVEFWLLKDHKQEIDRALMLYQGVFSWSSDAIYTLDAQRRITNANLAFETLAGTDRQQIIGQSIDRFIAAPQCSPETSGRFEAQLLGAQNQRLDVLVSEHPIKEGTRIVGYQGIATDYTERKRLAEELRATNEKLEALVHLDGLTGVNNRRYFDAQFEVEWRRCLRAKVPLSLILIDIDLFKLYNDHYGHQAGDACLTQVAQGLRDNLKRAGDMVARYGGEEFVILLPSTDAPSAAKVAEYLLTAIARSAIPHQASLVAPVVTLSLGVATLPVEPDPELTPAKLLAAADAALYRAKKGGRNRFEAT